MKPNRDRPRLNLAKDAPCIRCGREGETRAAHYCGWRSHAFGKGRGIKGSDSLVAFFCQNCDDRYSEANYGTWQGGSKNIERSEEFLYFIALTTIWIENND